MSSLACRASQSQHSQTIEISTCTPPFVLPDHTSHPPPQQPRALQRASCAPQHHTTVAATTAPRWHIALRETVSRDLPQGLSLGGDRGGRARRSSSFHITSHHSTARQSHHRRGGRGGRGVISITLARTSPWNRNRSWQDKRRTTRPTSFMHDLDTNSTSRLKRSIAAPPGGGWVPDGWVDGECLVARVSGRRKRNEARTSHHSFGDRVMSHERGPGQDS